MSNYVCAFRGRRDDYQVPLALAERGRLDEFITDAYATPPLRKVAALLPGRARDAINFRYSDGIPDARVKCLWITTAIEHVRHRMGLSRALTYAKLDQVFSRSAARSARRSRSNLLLYTPYAWEAFTARYRHQPKRMLFQYHPHASFEERLLRRDAETFPEIAHSFEQETGSELPAVLRERINNAWRHADGIFCASNFTRQTLVDAGADPKLCVVTPYGIDRDEIPDEREGDRARGEEFRVLFVGSGVQRKGLHHLLLAWERARLPARSSLTLVCRMVDPGLRERIARARDVNYLPGLRKSELDLLYRRSSLLAMPSFTEGFGQVYLEALSWGCPVLGTAHTCLPDLGTEEDGIFLVEVASIDHLTHQLEELALRLPEHSNIRVRARTCARKFSWSRFRNAVVAGL